MGNSVGWGCSTIIREDIVSHVCVLGVQQWGTNLSKTVVSSYLAQEYTGLYCVVGLCCWCQFKPPLIVYFILCVLSRCFRIFIAFCL